MTNSLLTQYITRRSSAGQTALIPFITAGFPNKNDFWQVIQELAQNGADIIEIGVPFSDPVADGPTVAKASEDALEQGVTLTWLLRGLQEHRAALAGTGIVLMGYANPFLRYGWPDQSGDSRLHNIDKATEKSLHLLAAALQKAGVEGLIIPDLPLEESAAWRNTLKKADVDLIPLVGINTSAERMRAYAAWACGYVYVVSVLGTTGVRTGFPPELEHTLLQAKDCFALPLALGFGLEHPRQIEGIPPHCRPHAYIFGSALLQHIRAKKPVADFMQPWVQDRKRQ